MLDKSRLEELVNSAIEWATNVSEQTTEDMINAIGISTEELRELGWNEDSLKILDSLPDYVGWSQVAVDTPILVRRDETDDWHKGHFAKYENGRVYAWINGATSWTANGTMGAWNFAKLAEINNNGKKIDKKNNTSLTDDYKKGAEAAWKLALNLRYMDYENKLECFNLEDDDREKWFQIMESNTFEEAQAKLDEWAHKSKCERKRSNKLWQVPVIWKVYGFNYILAPTFEEAAAIAESPLTPLPIQAELIDSTFSVDYEGRDIYNNENGALSALGAMLGEPVYADNAPTEKALYPIFFLEGESREKALRNTKEAKFDGENVTEDDLISYIKLSGAIFDAEGEFLAYRPDIYEEFFSEA